MWFLEGPGGVVLPGPFLWEDAALHELLDIIMNLKGFLNVTIHKEGHDQIKLTVRLVEQGMRRDRNYYIVRRYVGRSTGS